MRGRGKSFKRNFPWRKTLPKINCLVLYTVVYRWTWTIWHSLPIENLTIFFTKKKRSTKEKKLVFDKSATKKCGGNEIKQFPLRQSGNDAGSPTARKSKRKHNKKCTRILKMQIMGGGGGEGGRRGEEGVWSRVRAALFAQQRICKPWWPISKKYKMLVGDGTNQLFFVHQRWLKT